MEAIQHYDASTKTFAQSVSQKVKRLLELGKISKITDGLYQCLPIPGYNISTYSIREHFGRLLCNCQKGRKGGECSHVQAVRIFKKATENLHEEQLHIL